MSDCMEFGFDDAKVIKAAGAELFKQTRPGEISRISIVSFKRHHDKSLAKKAKEADRPLTEAEKAEYIKQVDAKIAERLGKPVEQLTEVDRLDVSSPKFASTFTHYSESVGTIRCLSGYEGSTMVKPEECCNRFGDADQKVGTVVMSYPVDKDGRIDMDLLKMKKYVSFFVWSMSSKKYKKLESVYVDARNDKKSVIDLKVTLDGDPKYQKQLIEGGSTAVWARDDFDPEIAAWILDQGLRTWRHVSSNLGFEMKLDKLLEKLGLSGGSSGHTQIGAGSSTAESPKLVTSYNDLL